MNALVQLDALAADKPLAIAVLAMGGQGGGVLADWIVALAESQGWIAQTTSVPGVAQRTGATIYYIEMLRERPGSRPVLSLMPTPGDVDVILAAEWMEAGRSMLRGLATPDKTVLIASTHRAYAVVEKIHGGDGAGDPGVVTDAADFATKRVISLDMEALAAANGGVISAALFGALAASGTLPFERDAFEATVKSGGKGIEASLRTFDAAFARVRAVPRDPVRAGPEKLLPPAPRSNAIAALDALLSRLRSEVPPPAQQMAYAALCKLVDYQDAAYCAEYLDELARATAADRAGGGEARDFELTALAAKYVAQAFAYDDPIRVADLKTRATRFARVRADIGAAPDAIMRVSEFMHPRAEEVCATMPAALGRWIKARALLFGLLDKLVNRGRRVQTANIFGFTQLWCVAALRPWRRRLLRHQQESAHREAWLASTLPIAATNYALACEMLRARKLVKGYSDTHSRGQSKFDRVIGAAPILAAREDGGSWMNRLIRAAEKDEDGALLDGALKTVASFNGA
jgi:indolepyruvate ferredoxin oxidoreductase, beta subunit